MSIVENYDPFIIDDANKAPDKYSELHKKIRKLLENYTPTISYYSRTDGEKLYFERDNFANVENIYEFIKKNKITYVPLSHHKFSYNINNFPKDYFGDRKLVAEAANNDVPFATIKQLRKQNMYRFIVDIIKKDLDRPTLFPPDDNVYDSYLTDLLNLLYSFKSYEILFYMNPAFFYEIFKLLKFETYYVKYYIGTDTLIIKVFSKLDDWFNNKIINEEIPFTEENIKYLMTILENLRTYDRKLRYCSIDFLITDLLKFFRNKPIENIKKLIKNYYNKKTWIKKILEILVFAIELVNYDIHILNPHLSEDIREEANVVNDNPLMPPNKRYESKKISFDNDICTFLNNNNFNKTINNNLTKTYEDYSKLNFQLNPVLFSGKENLGKITKGAMTGGSYIFDKKTNEYVKMYNTFIKYFELYNFNIKPKNVTYIMSLLDEMNINETNYVKYFEYSINNNVSITNLEKDKLDKLYKLYIVSIQKLDNAMDVLNQKLYDLYTKKIDP